MKLIPIIIGVLLLSVELHSQPYKYSSDTMNVKVVEVPKENKPLYEKPWFPTLLGSCIGALLGLSVTYGMYRLANSYADDLRVEQETKDKAEKEIKEKKEVIFLLRDCLAEIAAYNIKLRVTANEFYNMDFEYYYDVVKALQIGNDIKAQELRDNNKQRLIDLRQRKNRFDFLVADMTKWTHYFMRFMKTEEREQTSTLLAKILHTDFKHFIFMFEKQGPYREYHNLNSTIDKDLVTPRLIDKTLLPLGKILKGVVNDLEKEID